MNAALSKGLSVAAIALGAFAGSFAAPGFLGASPAVCALFALWGGGLSWLAVR